MIAAMGETVALVVNLSRATSTRAIYPAGHPSVASAIQELLEAFERCLAARREDEITFLIIDRDVVVDDRPLRTKSLYLRPFVQMMNRLGIQRFTLARGLTAEEASTLLTAFSTGEQVPDSPHVVVGRVELGDEAGGGAGGSDSGETVSEEDIDRGAAAFRGLSGSSGGSVEELDRLVWRVIEGLAGSSRSLLLLAPVRSFDDSLFLHSVNVSVLAAGLCRSLGIEGATLHEIGLSALLHDVGKLSLPRHLWERQGRLEGEDWEKARLHPELGAATLSGMEGIPPLAVVVAYEHHLRWDCEPSYPACRRQPTFASQVTAVADTWDAIAGGRLDLAGPARRAALRVWRERSGTYLDPFLVDQFLLLLSGAGEGPG